MIVRERGVAGRRLDGRHVSFGAGWFSSQGAHHVVDVGKLIEARNTSELDKSFWRYFIFMLLCDAGGRRSV